MTINVHNLSNESHSGLLHTVSVNVVRATINGVSYDLPQIVPNKLELTYAETVGRPLNNSIFVYVYRLNTLRSLHNTNTVQSITNDYRQCIRKHGLISDFFMQVAKNNQIPNGLRSIIHEIQFDAGATIISDYEPNREQTVATFAEQIISTRDRFSNNDISPTLDIGTSTINRFSDKLQWAMDNGFNRINVIYRAVNATNIRNWLALSRVIHGNNVWINVVGVLPRYHVTTKVSTISTVFLFGVHTVSLGHAWYDTPNAASYLFNPQTHRFNLVNHMTYPQCRVNSVASLDKELAIARNHILRGNYFRDYVTTKQGLQQSLNSIT